MVKGFTHCKAPQSSPMLFPENKEAEGEGRRGFVPRHNSSAANSNTGMTKSSYYMPRA